MLLPRQTLPTLASTALELSRKAGVTKAENSAKIVRKQIEVEIVAQIGIRIENNRKSIC